MPDLFIKTGSYTPFTCCIIKNMDNYTSEILEWRESIEINLRKENSWLALVGLFWLEEGRNTFGTSDENDIVFPDANIPEQIGAFIVDGDNVRMLQVGYI